MKKVGIIGTNGLPGNYGGWDQLVNHLTIHLKDDFSFIVYTSYTNAIKGLKEYNGAKLIVISLKANGVQSIFFDMLSLFHAAIFCDTLYICGTSGCIFLPIIKLFGKRIILNPDGMEWKRKKWSKPIQWFLKISERIGVKYANTVVADNIKIKETILESYNRDSVLIEYGGDNASFVQMSNETKVKYNIEPNNYAFKVCRIEPENNIDLILEAFKESGNKILLVGNWNNSKYGILLKQKYKEFNNLKLLDPIYNQQTLDELRSNCSLYIHGHSVGGTNPSLVEAMNLGLFIVAYNVSYNIETTENSTYFFNTKSDLLDILKKFNSGAIETKRNKDMMKSIAQRRYLWRLITDKYKKIF